MNDRPFVTALYVPGDRPERFDKAVATGADLVILDLEDAVAPAKKAEARGSVAQWLSNWKDPAPVIEVRINARCFEDLAALHGTPGEFGLRVPKVETVEDLEWLAPSHRPLTVVLETACAVENAVSIATHPAVTRVTLGESDLTSDLGSRSPAILDYARARLLFATRAAHLPPPMLSPYPDIRDLDGLRADTERGRDLGWFGRTAIHPSQLSVINEVFMPSDAELKWANDVISSVESGGVSTLPSGEMIDPAMVGRAQAVLNRHVEQTHSRSRATKVRK